MTRYTPARHYLTFGIVAVGLAGFSAWLGLDWMPAFIPAALFLLSAGLLLALAFRPAVEIHEGYLASANASCRGWISGAWIAPAGFRR